MTLRRAGSADVAALADLERVSFAADAWGADTLRAEVEGDGRYAVVALDGDRVIGYAVTMLAGDLADLHRIAVHPEARRRGVARRLLAEGIDRARADGAESMLLEVSSVNEAAVAFYLAHGFTEIGRRRAYYRDGTDAVVMRRELAEPGRLADAEDAGRG